MDDKTVKRVRGAGVLPSRALLSALAVLGAGGSAFAQGAPGAQLFAQNCAACHQAQGQGVPGAFPALAGDPFVVGAPKAVASVLLHGRGGMPNFSEDLSDADIASVLSFVRSSWGNHAPPLDAATVASVRGGALKPADASTAVLPYH